MRPLKKRSRHTTLVHATAGIFTLVPAQGRDAANSAASDASRYERRASRTRGQRWHRRYSFARCSRRRGRSAGRAISVASRPGRSTILATVNFWRASEAARAVATTTLAWGTPTSALATMARWHAVTCPPAPHYGPCSFSLRNDCPRAEPKVDDPCGPDVAHCIYCEASDWFCDGVRLERDHALLGSPLPGSPARKQTAPTAPGRREHDGPLTPNAKGARAARVRISFAPFAE
jgi:hypothetical protein